MEGSQSTAASAPPEESVNQQQNSAVGLQPIQPQQPQQQVVYVQPQQPVVQQQPQVVYIQAPDGQPIQPQQQVIYVQQPQQIQPTNNQSAPQYIYQQPNNQPGMTLQTQQFDAALVGNSSKTSIRATGKRVNISQFSISRYNYSIKCMESSFSKNGLESKFKGKYIPIKTWYWDEYEDRNVHRSMYGRCFNCFDWCCCLGILGMLITAMVVQTCSYAELTVDTDTDTWDDNDCYSLWNNYDTDTYNTYDTNTNSDFNGMFYNEYVGMWRNISLGVFFSVLVMVVIYAVFIRVLIINRRNEKELLTFCGKAGQYSFNMQNEFFEVSRSEYINIVGLTSNVVKATNSNTQSQHVIDQTNIYGGKFELSSQSIHVMLYKKVWWTHFKTARFRIWFWFISYIVAWVVSMKAMNRWYSTETY